MGNEKNILDEIGESCHQINLILGSICQKIEAARKKNFWGDLDKDIDDSLKRIKMGVEIQCSNMSDKFDCDMLKEGGLVYKMEFEVLYSLFIQNRWFQPDFHRAVIRPLDLIMEARRKGLNLERKLTKSIINASMSKISK